MSMEHAHNRFMALKETLEDDDRFRDVVHTEDFIPPHKQAGFVPYDAILGLDLDVWGAGDIEHILDVHDLGYEEVLAVTENDDPFVEGEALAYVSLVDF